MSHRHITVSAVYEDGDSLVSATPASDDPVCQYTLPQQVTLTSGLGGSYAIVNIVPE